MKIYIEALLLKNNNSWVEILSKGKMVDLTPVPNREQKSPKVELSREYAGKCLCPNCPTYLSNDCPSNKQERVFCSIGMTGCGNLEQLGCLCGNCPVFIENSLKIGYFCVKGEADEAGEPVSRNLQIDFP